MCLGSAPHALDCWPDQSWYKLYDELTTLSNFNKTKNLKTYPGADFLYRIYLYIMYYLFSIFIF